MSAADGSTAAGAITAAVDRLRRDVGRHPRKRDEVIADIVIVLDALAAVERERDALRTAGERLAERARWSYDVQDWPGDEGELAQAVRAWESALAAVPASTSQTPNMERGNSDDTH